MRDINNKKAVTCDFCLKVTNGGITRATKHQLGVKGDVNACRKCPPEVKQLLLDAANKKKSDKSAYNDELQQICSIRSGKRKASSSIDTLSTAKKGKNVKGPMDLLLLKGPEESLKLSKAEKLRQTSINDACDKEARVRTIQYIARFFYRAGISFNVANLKCFKLMVEAIGNYG